jgi:hypothetical protein
MSTELDWKWPMIACVLVQKLAPAGLVITRKDLRALPQDRVLFDERSAERIEFSFVSLERAELVRNALAARGEKAGVSALEGKWQKIAAVVLWKLAPNGVTVMRADKDALPDDKTLLMHGHADDLELRFVPRTEAQRIARWEADNEGKSILETVQ